MAEQTINTQRKRFYLTTAINYTNGAPHMGHAYEAIMTDIIARYHRLEGEDVFFLTGSDEHGQKVAQKAESLNITPIEVCDRYSNGFQALNKQLLISNDFYVRTTQAKHKEACQWLWKKALDAGDIYLGDYEGWYDVREEAFITEAEAEKSDYKDKYGVPLEKRNEPCYFFKMSKYQERLLAHINANPDFIKPERRKKEVLERLSEPLHDLSISRTKFTWGVQVPGDDKHVMYVWFDALTNYLSAIDYHKNGENAAYWPAGIQIIGKDITWFHCVIWPCMLMSTGIPLPKVVFGHGFINGPDGRKMSKSLGNVVDPLDILKRHAIDPFRYFLAREASFGEDLNFSEESMVSRCNGELANTWGNLARRACVLVEKYEGGKVPEVVSLVDKVFNLDDVRNKYREAMSRFAISEALEIVFEALRTANGWLTEQEPWKMKDDPAKRSVVLRTILEAVFICAHLLFPVLPETIEVLFAKCFQCSPITIGELTWDNFTAGSPIAKGPVLYKKLEIIIEDIQRINFCVGTITKVDIHEELDKIYILKIDFKEEYQRQILSGLREYYTAEELLNKKVIAVLNLKPRKIRGKQSKGMVLTAEHGGVVKLLDPKDAEPGTPVIAKGLEQNLKKTIKINELGRIKWAVNDGKIIVTTGKSGERTLVAGNVEINADVPDGAEIK